MLSTCLVTLERMINKCIHGASIRQRLGEKIGNYSFSLKYASQQHLLKGQWHGETTRAVEVKEIEYFPRDTYEVC